MKLLIVGLGNILQMDDGVGVHAVRELQKNPIPGVETLEAGVAVLGCLSYFEEADTLLALDAVQAGGEPGTIYELRFKKDKKRIPEAGIHELDLRDAVCMLPKEKRPEILMLGVEPFGLDSGMELSHEVKKVIPEYLELIRKTALSLLNS